MTVSAVFALVVIEITVLAHGADFMMVGERIECSGADINRGVQSSVEDCAASCEGEATMFIYGTNEFGNPRCDDSGAGCRCYCETAAFDWGQCQTAPHNRYNLYRLLPSDLPETADPYSRYNTLSLYENGPAQIFDSVTCSDEGRWWHWISDWHECMQKAIEDPECNGQMIRVSLNYPTWGCSCCMEGSAIVNSEKENWTSLLKGGNEICDCLTSEVEQGDNSAICLSAAGDCSDCSGTCSAGWTKRNADGIRSNLFYSLDMVMDTCAQGEGYADTRWYADSANSLLSSWGRASRMLYETSGAEDRVQRAADILAYNGCGPRVGEDCSDLHRSVLINLLLAWDRNSSRVPMYQDNLRGALFDTYGLAVHDNFRYHERSLQAIGQFFATIPNHLLEDGVQCGTGIGNLKILDEWSCGGRQNGVGCAFNVFNTQVGYRIGGGFPAEIAASGQDGGMVVIKHEVVHQWDRVIRTESMRPEMTAQWRHLLASSEGDDLNYLRDTIGWKFFKNNSQEVNASQLGNQYLGGSETQLELALKRLDDWSNPLPMEWFLYNVEVFADGGSIGRFYYEDPPESGWTQTTDVIIERLDPSTPYSPITCLRQVGVDRAVRLFRENGPDEFITSYAIERRCPNEYEADDDTTEEADINTSGVCSADDIIAAMTKVSSCLSAHLPEEPECAPGRCGPLFNGCLCDGISRRYCNEANGYCGNTWAHQHYQDSTKYDYVPPERALGSGIRIVAEMRECGGEEVHAGYFATVEECASACKGVAPMFIFGTNDFGTERCDENGICRCYCETAAEPNASCSEIRHEGYVLYRYVADPPSVEMCSCLLETELDCVVQRGSDRRANPFVPGSELIQDVALVNGCLGQAVWEVEDRCRAISQRSVCNATPGCRHHDQGCRTVGSDECSIVKERSLCAATDGCSWEAKNRCEKAPHAGDS